MCLATLGPGATNLATGIGDATLDKAPLVALTGQIPLAGMHKETHQFIDTVDMLRPMTKWNTRVHDPRMISEAVRKAFSTAAAEKPGATHLELPEDVMATRIVGPPAAARAAPDRRGGPGEPAARRRAAADGAHAGDAGRQRRGAPGRRPGAARLLRARPACT